MKAIRVQKNLKRIGWKAGLNSLLVFHLMGIALAPLGLNYIGHQLGPWLEPYLRSLQLASSWGFFAPDPGPPPIYIEYEVRNLSGHWVETFQWPARRDPYFLRERQIWRIAASRHLMNQANGMTQMFGPHICAKHPSATQVRFYSVSEDVPALLDVQGGKRYPGDQKWVERRYLTTLTCGGIHG